MIWRESDMRAVAALLAVGFAAACIAQEGAETIVRTDRGPDKRGKPQKPSENVCWLPRDCDYVRGVIVGHPMIESLATEERFRTVAAEEGLGTMLIRAMTWDVARNWEILDDILKQWAERSGHPELRGAPVLVSGLSASVLMARLLVYERPERCFGIIHVAGGNLQEQYPKGKSLSGVPFMAVNGEYESCGPAGGIRPHLGFDTQWYLMGEQMLERRREDPNHLMSMVVVPIKGHTAWSKELGELFIRKCAEYRLPKEKRDGSSPARCVEIKAEDGWLTHRDVKHPKYPPAAWADYPGDKLEAFWHLDEEMARAVCQYHIDGKRSGQDRSLFRPEGLFDRLWPIPQRMDIPFKGHGIKEYAAAIEQWVKTRTGDEVSPSARRNLALGIAEGLQKAKDGDGVDEATCRKMCLRVCYAYDDAYRPLETAILDAALPDGFKQQLLDNYAQKVLLLWTNGKFTPRLSIRETQSMIVGMSANKALLKAKGDKLTELIQIEEETAAVENEKAYGAPPETLAQLASELEHADAKIGWAAAEKIAEIGRPAIPAMVRTMEWAGSRADMRAAGALGKMGSVAAPALPDLKRFAASGGRWSEATGLVCVKALEAIELIEKDE